MREKKTFTPMKDLCQDFVKFCEDMWYVKIPMYGGHTFKNSWHAIWP